MRAVLDSNVFVSALISPSGSPREIVEAWVQGRFELVVSPMLLGELRAVLVRAKFRRWISATSAERFVDGLEDASLVIDDPATLVGLSPDPDDDYLLSLARIANADYLVSGDSHLTDIADPTPPVVTPRRFRDLLSEATE